MVKCYSCLYLAYELFKETNTDYSDPSVNVVPMRSELLHALAVYVDGFIVCWLFSP